MQRYHILKKKPDEYLNKKRFPFQGSLSGISQRRLVRGHFENRTNVSGASI